MTQTTTPRAIVKTLEPSLNVQLNGAPDTDPQETQDWIESLDAVIDLLGPERARHILRHLFRRARLRNVLPAESLVTDYVNTIHPEDEPSFPGDERMEKRVRRIIRWNAAVMVSRANTKFAGLGGHISTYASSASLYEVGFNHFFRGRKHDRSGDQIFFQGHAAPGIYARAFLEGRLTEANLDSFRRESARDGGLSSYPHPRLMGDFWEFPTVSMGLGPIAAIYQARFNRYLEARGLLDTSKSRVWCFVGDGETDEPESLGSLSIAAREGLDNLTFVINCNLQRLDGPVRGNGQIIQELERVFRGAGWHVIKVIWGREWDELFAADEHGLLRSRVNQTVDGQWQRYMIESGEHIRNEFFGTDPRLLELVEHLSDDQIRHLRRGGHDYRKIYAAYQRATEQKGRPTVILAHTIKGWTLGEGFEAKNVTHQMKKLSLEELRAFRDLLELPIPDKELPNAPFYHPGPDSEEVQYMLERRRALGGFVPTRDSKPTVDLKLPETSLYEEFTKGTGDGEGVSTTMAFVRLLAKLLRDKEMGKRIVPIIPDEARTFGMEPLFRQVGIYSSVGQLYEPVDKNMLLYYREATNGQVLEEGITEAGSMASFQAAGTSHATHGQPMIPFYIFYSMFGYQRTGDQMWAFGDIRGRGFLLGATAGRTTLNGEGLQHQDGHTHILASTHPSVVTYDPSWAYEIAVIIEEGLRRMYGEGEDIYYYLTLQNENYSMPAMPADAREGILKGLYLFDKSDAKRDAHVTLFGSGSIMNEVLRARDILKRDFSVSADVYSATSYGQLRRDAIACERWNRLHPAETPKTPYVTRVLEGVNTPIIAASDYMKLVPEQVCRFISQRLVPMGTDGYGMSDTREALRRHFEVDAESIVIAALHALAQEGKLKASDVTAALAKFDYDVEKIDPLSL